MAKTLTKPNCPFGDEIEAINVVGFAIKPLATSGRRRVLQYIVDFYGLNITFKIASQKLVSDS